MSSQFVNVPVPEDRVLEVMEFLTRARRPEGDARPSADQMQPASQGAIVTDPDVVGRAYRESPPAMKQFFELLAKQPDDWVAIDELRAAMGLKTHALPGVLGAFQRRWKGHYKQGGRWPFDAEWSDATESWTWRYRMPKE